MKSVTIAGHGAGDTTIRAGIPMSVFEVTGPLDATISGVTIRDGNIAGTGLPGAGISERQANLHPPRACPDEQRRERERRRGVSGGVALGGAICATKAPST